MTSALSQCENLMVDPFEKCAMLSVLLKKPSGSSSASSDAMSRRCVVRSSGIVRRRTSALKPGTKRQRISASRRPQ